MRFVYNLRVLARELIDNFRAWLSVFIVHDAHRHAARLGNSAAVISRTAAASARSAALWLRSARQLRLFAMELAGIVLVAFGVSYWSVPSAIILGGLVLVAAVEVRPHVGSSIPALPVPEPLLRAQAEQAARLLNNVRYGVAEVDAAALDKLSRDQCERIITIARSIGVKT